MHSRTPLVLALGLAVGLTGCSGTLSGGRLFGPAEPPEPVLKPNTYVAFADYRATAGFDKEQAEPARQLYREEARVSYLKAIEVDASCLPAHLGLARLLSNWERHAEAAAAYQKALALSPADAGLWYELGMCQGRQKQWPEAAASLGRAVELAPQQRRYVTHLGLALARSERYPEALAALTQAAGAAQAHYELARMLQHTNQTDLARRYAAEALRLDPNLAGARAMLMPEPPAAPPAPPAAAVRTVSHANAPPPQFITPGAPARLPAGVADGDAARLPEGPAAHRPRLVPPMPVISLRR